jgi:micrococcal nuclease
MRFAVVVLLLATASCGSQIPRSGAAAPEPPTNAPSTGRAPNLATPIPAPAGLTISSVRSPVSRGGTGQATIHTAANADCSITVRYKSGPSTAQGLGPKTTDSSGNATWSWTVGTNTTTGSWPIEVRCGSVRAQTTFEVR